MAIRETLIEEDPGPPLESTEVLEILTDDASRKILAACMDDARAVKEISDQTGLPLSTTYRHVHDMVDQGVLECVRSAISPSGKRYDLYESRLSEAGLRLTSDGLDVQWAGRNGDDG